MIIAFSLKSGNLPPEDIEFEELEDGNLTSLRKVSSSKLNLNAAKSPNPFQKKRDLEKQIQVKEKEVENGKKHSLQNFRVIITCLCFQLKRK